MNFNYETDAPLDDEMESMIERIGPKNLLKEMMARMDIKISKPLDELSDGDCTRTIRGIYRNSSDYRGSIQ